MTEAQTVVPEKPTKAKPPEPPKRPADGTPVRVLRFVDIVTGCGLQAASSVTCDVVAMKRGQKHWIITYQPSIRHHTVTLSQPGSDPATMYIHESRIASWEPLL